MVYLVCSECDRLPIDSEDVRWLDKEEDYKLARLYWLVWGQVLSYSQWCEAHEFGYQYVGIIEDHRIISSAGIWRFSEKFWEIVAVSTLEDYRRKGYSKKIIAFLTSYVHKSGRLATCRTGEANIAMIATAKSVGFTQVLGDEIGWSYPKVPDF